ncbi:MAG: hypothetical protein WC375_04015 [Methanomassiliicoccales archaeon]|jgi:hypothetical protein
MKVRNGFVSNSSSSSFALIGISIPIYQLKPTDIKKTIYVVGRWNGDGADVFSIENEDMLKFVQEHQEYFRHVFVEARLIDESSPLSCTRKDLPSKVFTILTGSRDHHGSECLADLQSRYGKVD